MYKVRPTSCLPLPLVANKQDHNRGQGTYKSPTHKAESPLTKRDAPAIEAAIAPVPRIFKSLLMKGKEWVML